MNRRSASKAIENGLAVASDAGLDLQVEGTVTVVLQKAQPQVRLLTV